MIVYSVLRTQPLGVIPKGLVIAQFLDYESAIRYAERCNSGGIDTTDLTSNRYEYGVKKTVVSPESWFPVGSLKD